VHRALKVEDPHFWFWMLRHLPLHEERYGAIVAVHDLSEPKCEHIPSYARQGAKLKTPQSGTPTGPRAFSKTSQRDWCNATRTPIGPRAEATPAIISSVLGWQQCQATNHQRQNPEVLLNYLGP